MGPEERPGAVPRAGRRGWSPLRLGAGAGAGCGPCALPAPAACEEGRIVSDVLRIF